MTSSIFSAVEMAPRDPILGLNEAFNADARTTKGVQKVVRVFEYISEEEARRLDGAATPK